MVAEQIHANPFHSWNSFRRVTATGAFINKYVVEYLQILDFFEHILPIPPLPLILIPPVPLILPVPLLPLILPIPPLYCIYRGFMWDDRCVAHGVAHGDASNT